MPEREFSGKGADVAGPEHIHDGAIFRTAQQTGHRTADPELGAQG